MSFFSKFFTKEKKEDLNQGLEKTKASFFEKISKAVAGKDTVDEEVLDNLENILITSDVGLDTTVKIIKRIEARVAKDKYLNATELNSILRDEIVLLLSENNTVDVEDYDLPEGPRPHVMLVVGVNGVGKTTTIGKIAFQHTIRDKKVVLGLFFGAGPVSYHGYCLNLYRLPNSCPSGLLALNRHRHQCRLSRIGFR